MSTEIPGLAPPPAVWDEEVDVVVVGFGGAGACAALEAAAGGARVLVVERYLGGGATAVSGGVVYAGGGTSVQVEAGFADTVDDMFRYLHREVQGAVSDATLRHFCDTSAGTLEWLRGHGVPFQASFCPFKTSYPTDDHYLYYSGNEAAAPYRDEARPAPRGHRAHGPGLSGRPLFGALRAAVDRAGIPVRTGARVERLVAGSDGGVLGVEYATFAEGAAARRRHAWWCRVSDKASNYSPRLRRLSRSRLEALEAGAGERRRVRARGGVILAAGGFVRNREMLDAHAPDTPRVLALGAVGDDGLGIRLGQSAGGAVDRMDRVSLWRFYNPPVAFVKGVLVDREGVRICNEELYGATVGRRIAAHGNTARLILDATTRSEVLSRLTAETVPFQRLTALYLLTLGHVRAGTVDGLAARLGMPRLPETIARYNEGAGRGVDPFGKSVEVLRPVVTPPFYAMDVSVGRNPFYPTPSLTLGGLVVDEATGGVRRADGTRVPGLFAAGRTAVGVCSEDYVSGLSIADAVYSGRRAGRVAAGGEWRR